MNNSLKIQKITTLGLAIAAFITASNVLPSYAGEFSENHPRRAEVVHRDNNINSRLNGDYGKLDGHYGQLKARDQQIHNQERRDARVNGGYITKGEQKQLNHEENHLNRRIRADKS